MIVSRQNQLIKEIRSLADKKNRDALGLYIAEGVKMTNEAIRCLYSDVVYIVGTECGLEKIKGGEEKKILVSPSVFDAITNEVTPQGVLAVLRLPEKKIEAPTKSCILLDGVADPANVGAIIRTAVASGYTEIYCIDTADAYSPKSVRASMSGIYKAKVYSASREQILDEIKFPLIVADMMGESVYDFNSPKEFCLVIGNEGNGVSKQIKEKASFTVSIPMENGTESLNAGVSAGILMYFLRQK
jgi:TrmH family RNA methyltransferase